MADIHGYQVAGKTGTAQRADSAAAATTAPSVSFAGFAPADDPRFVVYVVIKHPQAGAGGGGDRRSGLPRPDGRGAAEVRRAADREARALPARDW